MVELRFGPKTVDLPYSVRIANVSDKMFDELVDEDTRAELIDGVMIVHSPASIQHDDVGGFLRALMRLYAERKKLGKVLGPDSLIQLARGRKLAPDLYLVTARALGLLKRKVFRGTPDFLAEILSPSNRYEDLELKRPVYRRAGIKEMWFIDPDKRRVVVERRTKTGYQTSVHESGKLISSALAGFWIKVEWLWADPLPDLLDSVLEILG